MTEPVHVWQRRFYDFNAEMEKTSLREYNRGNLMFQIDVSKFRYITVLSLLSDLFLGTDALGGAVYFSEKARSVVSMAAHTSGSILVVSCFVAAVLTYSTGLSLSTLAVFIGAPIEAAASLKSKKDSPLSDFQPRSSWVALTRATLARAGIQQVETGKDWLLWFQILQARFGQRGMEPGFLYVRFILGVGIVFLLLIAGFPEARNPGMAVGACLNLVLGGLLLFIARTRAENVEKSQVRQEKSMLEFLLEPRESLESERGETE
jgi:hypothetical protein